MLRRDDPIRQAAERLRKTVKKDRGKQGIQPATVVGTRGKNDRDVIECELETGEIVNAIAHGQGEFMVGQVVYLERLHGKNGRHWLVVTSASPPDGSAAPPPPKAIQMHKGKPKGVKRVPAAELDQYMVNGRILTDPTRTMMKLNAELADGTEVAAVYRGEDGHALYGEIAEGDQVMMKAVTGKRWYGWTVPELAGQGDVPATVTEAPEPASYELFTFASSIVLLSDVQTVLQLTNTGATYVQVRLHLTKEMETGLLEWWIFAFEDSDSDGEFGDEFFGKPNWGFPVRDTYVNDDGDEQPKVLEGYGDLTEPEAVALLSKEYFAFVLGLVRSGEGYVKRSQLPLVRKCSLRLLDDVQYEGETGVDPWPFQDDDEVPL